MTVSTSVSVPVLPNNAGIFKAFKKAWLFSNHAFFAFRGLDLIAFAIFLSDLNELNQRKNAGLKVILGKTETAGV